jgi:hypothetical protein
MDGARKGAVCSFRGMLQLRISNVSVCVTISCVQAVLAGGKVYAVDRIDVPHTPEPPGVPVTLPSLMWSEITVQVRTATQ